MEKIIKLSEYARLNGIKYRAAWNRYKADKIDGAYVSETGHIVVKITDNCNIKTGSNNVIIYARVSSSENKANLEYQAKRLQDYATMRGYNIVDVVKEVGSGLNDKRPKLIKLLNRIDYSKIVVENKDRLTRFGFNYIETLLNQSNRHIEVVNQTKDDKSDIVQDLVSIVYSFSARLYGSRRANSNKDKVLAMLKKEKI